MAGEITRGSVVHVVCLDERLLAARYDPLIRACERFYPRSMRRHALDDGGITAPLRGPAFCLLVIKTKEYIAETIGAGLTSVSKTQMSAALALGMSRTQAVRTIILPQAVIRMLPSLGSLFVFAVKDSAIASVIAVPELLRQTQVVAGNTYHPFELYTAAMLVYFLLCFPVARGVDMIYKRVAHLGSS